MLQKIFISVCIIAVLSSGCNQATATPTVVVQQLPPTSTSTPRPTATKTPTPRSFFTNARTRIASLTPTQTVIPTLTPTPKPVPTLVAHEWTTDPILLRFGEVDGDGAFLFESSLPSLILYSDGTLIYKEWQRVSSDDIRIKLWQVNLSRQQICSLLNSIDQTDFFNYDPSTYLPKGKYLPFDGASDTAIEVYAWQSKQISIYGLSIYLDDKSSVADALVYSGSATKPYIPAALRETYKLLTHFRPDGATTYQPNRLAIRINDPAIYTRGQSWPLTSTKIIDLYNRSDSGRNLVIATGPESTAIYEVFDNSFGDKVFDAAPHFFLVTVRPLLPYEQPEFKHSYNPIDTPPDLRRPMSCAPNDGILPIP
jgi:hypothetical protein